MTPQQALSTAACVACLSLSEQEDILTYAALNWLAFIASNGSRPVTPWTPQQALTAAGCVACLSDSEKDTIVTASSLNLLALVQAAGVRPLATITPQEAMDGAGCVACLSLLEMRTIIVQSAIVQIAWLQSTTDMTPQEALSQAACVACLSPNERRIIQTLAGLSMIEYVDTGGCPPGGGGPGNPQPVYWGNYIWGDSPDPAPTFTEADIIGVNALYVDRNTLSTSSRVGNYTFAARAGARQVLVISQALGTPTFTVSGFPWQLDPAANTPVQVGLTVSGVVCDVYFTSQQNTGGYVLACS